jgi:hypothetical protein
VVTTGLEGRRRVALLDGAGAPPPPTSGVSRILS